MTINKKRDFKKVSVCIQEFLSKLPCDESTGFLRDTLYLSLLELHKYYLKEKERLNLSLPPPCNSLTFLPAVAHHGCDKYDEKWHGYQQNSNETNSQGFLAAHEGNIRNLKDIVQSDDVDELGQMYLMYAVLGKSEHQVECIEYLLSLKFDIDKQTSDGRTALHLACQFAQKTIVVTLLKNKASTTIQDNKGRAALHWAAVSPSSDIVKLLLQHGADINVKDCDSMMPAMWACHFNKLENLHVLKNALERIDPRPEAIFDERDKNGGTVLHWAVPSKEKDGDLQCLKDLLVCDASHIRNDQGRTVLHTAATKGCVSACELILSVCGKEILHIKDKQNQTALHLATLCGHGETVDYLLQNGANASDENSAGKTALQAAEFGHFHYCLLVYAAFEQMKLGGEKNKPLIKTPREEDRNEKKSKKYESWVIPTGFLHDSQEIPETEISHELAERQLVDVTELKGFEVNGDLETPHKTTESIPISRINENHSAPKAKQGTPLQRSIRVEDEAKDDQPLVPEDREQEEVDRQQGQADVVDGKTKFNTVLQRDNEQLQEEELLEYSSQYLQQHGSVLSNNSSEDDENYSVSENIEISSIGDETDEESKSEHEYLEKQKKNEQEKKTNTEKSEDPELENDPSTEIKNNGLNSQDIVKGHRGNLAPIKPLTQPGFSMPGKLDPIPLSLTARKTLNPSQNGQALQPRGIVAPLQPPSSSVHQKERPVLLRDKRSYSDTNNTPYYGARGPGHGPLAQAHGKALLNDVFQDVSKRKSEVTSPETQRRAVNNKPGKLPHPPAH